MKKTLTYFALIAGFFTSFAQEENGNDRRNDIMADPIIMIAGPVLNLSYERLLNEESGIGINTLAYLGKGDSDFLQVSPYYRMYFGKKFASGFFVEAFIPITSTNDWYYDYEYNDINGYYYNETYVENKKTTVGFGIAAGGKWVTRKNIVFEASGGIGRRFGVNEYDDYAMSIVPKGMLGIGYRF